MKFSHLLTTSAAAIIGSAALHAQQPADAAPPAQPNVEEETSGPDEAAISALEAAGITRRQYNSTLIATAYTGNDVTMQTLLAAGADVLQCQQNLKHGEQKQGNGLAHLLSGNTAQTAVFSELFSIQCAEHGADISEGEHIAGVQVQAMTAVAECTVRSSIFGT